MAGSAEPSSGPWTNRRLLVWTTQHFKHHGVESPRLACEMLLAHVLGVTRLSLYTDADRPASELERVAFRQLVERTVRHEPIDYLIGRTTFFSMMLRVSPDVLIPRPSTETLVEHMVQHARRTPGFGSPLVFEIGTGSGAVSIAVARHIPGCHVLATDISSVALKEARRNAREQGVADLVDFREGDLFEPLPIDQRAAYLVSNPPYISDREWQQVPPNVKNHEPHIALRGGADGLRFIRPLIAGARQYLDRPGRLVLEIATSQKEKVLELASQAPGLSKAHVLADHEGLPRVLVADAV